MIGLVKRWIVVFWAYWTSESYAWLVLPVASVMMYSKWWIKLMRFSSMDADNKSKFRSIKAKSSSQENRLGTDLNSMANKLDTDLSSVKNALDANLKSMKTTQNADLNSKFAILEDKIDIRLLAAQLAPQSEALFPWFPLSGSKVFICRAITEMRCFPALIGWPAVGTISTPIVATVSTSAMILSNGHVSTYNMSAGNVFGANVSNSVWVISNFNTQTPTTQGLHRSICLHSMPWHLHFVLECVILQLRHQLLLGL